MRVVLIALSALVLGACNMVVSREPLFSAADEDRAAPLREGLWVEVKADCEIDLAAPVADWPECADPAILRGGRLIDPDKPEQPTPYVLAGGSPRIMQIKVDEKDGKGRPLLMYAYAAVQPVRHDGSGRVIEARRWPVQCGPPPPAPKDATKAGDFTTRSPLPGLTVDPDLGVCWATAAAAVRNAAAASEAWDEDRSVIRWVREGD